MRTNRQAEAVSTKPRSGEVGPPADATSTLSCGQSDRSQRVSRIQSASLFEIPAGPTPASLSDMHGIEKRIVYILRSDVDPRHYIGIANDLRAETRMAQPWAMRSHGFPSPMVSGGIAGVPQTNRRQFDSRVPQIRLRPRVCESPFSQWVSGAPREHVHFTFARPGTGGARDARGSRRHLCRPALHQAGVGRQGLP